MTVPLESEGRFPLTQASPGIDLDAAFIAGIQGKLTMFVRVDRPITELPPPAAQDPNAAAALQELLGGSMAKSDTLAV